MNEKFEFEQYGVVALSDNEMVIIRGGDAGKVITKIVKYWGPLGFLASKVIQEWPEIKQGLADGWNADKY